MLILPIKKKWYDMIKSGEKKEEYREIKKYWTVRFNNEFDKTLESIIKHDIESDLLKYCLWLKVYLKNGYKKDAPILECECKLKIGLGREEWGAIPGKKYYILEILNAREIKNG